MATLSRACAIVAAMAFIGQGAVAAENFRRLNGSQISAAISGMEITDGTHWADLYERGGTLTVHSMGRKTNGRWRVQRDELCQDRGQDSSGCYQVWVSGNKVELRREGAKLPVEGLLQRPKKRN